MSKSITDIYARRGKRGEVERFDFSGAEAKKEIDQYIDTIKATKADLDADKAASAEYAGRAERAASSVEQSASSAAGNAADAISAAKSAKKSADDAAKVKSSVDISAGDATTAAEESRKIKEEISASVKTAADSATAAGKSAAAAADSARAAAESADKLVIDDALSGTSTNAIQNKVVSDNITELKEDLTNSELASAEALSQLGYNVNLHLEQGSISGSDGKPTSGNYSTNVRSDRFIIINPTITYHVKPKSHTFYVFFYDINKTYTTSLWGKYQPFDIILPSGSVYIKVVVGNNNSTDIVPSDVTETPYCVGTGALATEVQSARKSYPTIGDRIDDTDISANAYYGYVYDLKFEQGAIAGTGLAYESSTDIRTDYIKVLPSRYKINVNNYRVYALFYDKNKSLISGKNIWAKTADFDFMTDVGTAFIRIVANKTSGEAITPVDNAVTLINRGLYEISAGYQRAIGSDVVLPNRYTQAYLSNKKTEVMENIVDGTGITFAFITDLHLRDNSKSSKALVKYFLDHTVIPFVITGGDIPCAYSKTSGSEKTELYEDISEWNQWVEYWGQERVFQLRGNHDYVLVSKSNPDVYNNISSKRVWQVVCGKTDIKVHGDSSGCFYYFDIPAENIRFIVIDGHTINQSYPNVVSSWFSVQQRLWLCDALLDSDGMDVIIVSHETYVSTMSSYASNLSDLGIILGKCKNKEIYSVGDDSAWQSKDFAKCTANICFVLSGHSHKDEWAVDANGILCISTTCDACYNNDPDTVVRENGTLTESAFDIVSVDTAHQTIKTVRIGGGYNRGWNYSTGEELSE